MAMNEREIFETALEISDPKARLAFLDKACRGDSELRVKVDSLLKSHDSAGSFLDVPAVDQLGKSAANSTAQTIVGAPSAGDDDSDDGRADLSFLKASSKPGSIGTLGHYEILQVLGQGAFGIVFKAFDEKLHRHVAIKAMNPQLASTSPPRKRFLREARSVAALKHENVVQIYSVEEEPLPYLAMEFVDGTTLADKLTTAGPLEVSEILHLGRQMAAGLAAAHEKGLIHRDIKPGNILIEAGAEQKVKITDFGLARAADDATMTRTGTIAGTPMYMAPEQAMGQTLDHRADLFSLGSVLYQMACGRPPFRGANAIAVLKRVVDEDARPIQDILPEVPDWLCTIIAKLHAKSPDERYQSAKEVAELLSRCQNELQVNGKVTCVAVPKRAALGNSQGTKPDASVGLGTSANKAGTPSAKFRFIAVAAIVLLIGGFAFTEFTGITSFIRKPGDAIQPVAQTAPQVNATENSVEVTETTGWAGWPADAPKPALAPFNAEQAKQHQEEWATYLKVPLEYTNSIGMKFRLIPPGEFTMGMTKEEAEAVTAQREGWKAMSLSSSPEHRVRLTQAFYEGMHEVTQEQYEKVMGNNPSRFSVNGQNKEEVGGRDTKQHPVEMVSFIDAAEFCITLSKQEQFKPVYFSTNGAITLLPGDGYRLPTEAEWEYACRAGTNTAWFQGEQESTLGTVAWFGGNSGGMTHPVGQLKANPFGLYDVHGNVWEWCQDWYDPQAYKQRGAGPMVDPRGPETGAERVLRGGYWTDDTLNSRSAMRYARATLIRDVPHGFRVALPIDAVRQALKMTGPAMPKSPATDLATNKPAAESKDPDREVAEWVLSLPGGVNVMVLSERAGVQIVSQAADLPSDSFQVQGIFIGVAARVSDKDLARIGQCPSLIDLGVFCSDNSGISDAGIESLGHSLAAKSLRKLVFHSKLPNVSNGSVSHLNRLSYLEELYVLGQFSNEGLEKLNLPRLKSLRFVGPKITMSGFAQLAQRSPHITKLSFWTQLLDKQSLSPLKQWSLTELDLQEAQISDPQMEAIQDIPTLRVLNLNVNPISDEGVRRLLKLTELEKLGLYQTQVTDEACVLLSQLPKLQDVALHDTKITDAGLDSLAKLKNLQQLNLRDCKNLTAEGVRKLQMALPNCKIESDFKDPDREVAEWVLSLPEPRSLHIRVGDQQVEIMRLEDLPSNHFTVFDFGAGALPTELFTDRDLVRLGSLEHLSGFTIEGEPFTGITDQGIEAFSRAPAALQFHDFSLGKISNVTDASIPHFNRIKSLTGLNLSGSQISDAGIRQLALPELRGLILGHGVRVTPKGLAGLSAQCPNLVDVSFHKTGLGDADLSPLQQWPLHTLDLAHTEVVPASLQTVGKITTLQRLFIHGNSSINDETLHHLSGLTQLTTLIASHTAITDAGLEALGELRNLALLEVRQCKSITAEGVRKLQAALPDCKIESDFPNVTAMATPAVSPIDFNAERRAAEQLLKLHKGYIALMDNNGNLVELKESLPPENFFVHTVQFPNADLTDEELAVLVGCRGLVELSLYQNPKLTPVGLKAIGPLPRLKGLNLEGTQCARDGLAFIADFRALENLQLLDVDRVDGSDMWTLPPCPHLKVLSTTHMVGEDGLTNIAANCPALESLILNDQMVASLTPLAARPTLQHLHCTGAQLTDAGITALAGLPDFRRLWIDSPDSNLWSRLLPLKDRLQEIMLREQLTKAVAESIAILPVTEFKNAESVTIDGWIVVDAESLRQIGMLPQLRTLVIKDAIPPDQRAVFRKYTMDDVDVLRRQRPDVHFHIDGIDYPATK